MDETSLKGHWKGVHGVLIKGLLGLRLQIRSLDHGLSEGACYKDLVEAPDLGSGARQGPRCPTCALEVQRLLELHIFS